MEVLESFIQYNNTVLFQVSRESHSDTLIVFFHGIGDSHLNFTCFFKTPKLQHYDLFIADYLGHGRSGCAQTYSFAEQIDALATQLKPYIKHYKNIVFVPHSMGGIHATLLASNQFNNRINGIYAIETSITQYGSFVAQKVSEIITNGISFDEWFHSFCNDIYLSTNNNDVLKLYYSGLQLVQKQAFLENAMEMHELAISLTAQPFTNKIGALFAALPIPKVYCMGDTGKQLTSRPFLQQNDIYIDYYHTNSHWVAQVCFEEFCGRLDNFIQHPNQFC